MVWIPRAVNNGGRKEQLTLMNISEQNCTNRQAVIAPSKTMQTLTQYVTLSAATTAVDHRLEKSCTCFIAHFQSHGG